MRMIQILTISALLAAIGVIEPIDNTEAVPAGRWPHVFPHASVTVIAIDQR